ncbi:2Fe-2S ferredoxin-type domain-containing protein [Cynara cardunculus var. scolymus]|uniref:2Fe-2S ferredoxin-type domain-containing protein n=1 Tax=Cynara cardunculus var. scolymus TaxID=59895 RepID=A0A118JUG7_CYNCS|nr:2Fe-2S ferredoxin-type domain-containing protein [Cynara cardunculus var. scolymus]
MDLQAPCNIFCTTNYRTPSLFRQCSLSRNAINYNTSSSRCRRGTTSSEFQVTTGIPRPPRISVASSAPSHKVTVHDRQRDVVHEFYVPEDQYILHTAESQDISLPFACRHGCCTSCAGFALLCVGFPSSDVEVETQDEDEERDDYALELAMGDE